ncbi:Copper-binding protein CopC (methionine-rich) [Mycolicibacterium rutilum]|uniref:Copper-binding protein CopC (Methionine-rich) n=2 Tax=Mycobacteriaceae TaxID=1762 RepID=A0A1H6IZX8_MYCRU|nr:Copper-binding protein CopC (methionine-rich) [Mycolicibacterium rutilum]
MNPTLRTIVPSLGMLVALTCGSGIAAAHTALSSSDPAPDATVTAAPAAIMLTFNEDISPQFASVVVSSADGRNWISGSPQVEGQRLTAAVEPGRPGNGVYTVGYRVVSADGHPVTGSYKFTLADVSDEPRPISTSAAAAPSTAAPPPSTAAPATSDTKTTVITAGAAGLALGGVIAFWQSRRNRRKSAANDATRLSADSPDPS